MKICFITNNIFSLGGVQRVVSVLANELCDFYDIDIICTDHLAQENRELYNLDKRIKVKVINLNIQKDYKKYLYKCIRYINKRKIAKLNPKILFNAYYRIDENKLINLLNKEKYDAIIGVEGEFSIIIAKISKKLNTKTIGWQHNSYDAYFKTTNKYYFDQETIFKEYLNNLDYCIVLTNDDREKFSRSFNCYCRTIYNPLSFTSNVKTNCQQKKILFVGRLVKEQKGLDFLIKAFKIINIERKDWELNIVGDGPDRKWLVERIKSEGLNNNINIYDATKDIKKYYLDSSILISTSRWEGFGLVLTEAMECGVPVISFKNSGPNEIINNNGLNGILIDNYDYKKLAKSVLELINNYEKRINISINSIRRANEFKGSIIREKWSDIINENK